MRIKLYNYMNRRICSMDFDWNLALAQLHTVVRKCWSWLEEAVNVMYRFVISRPNIIGDGGIMFGYQRSNHFLLPIVCLDSSIHPKNKILSSGRSFFIVLAFILILTILLLPPHTTVVEQSERRGANRTDWKSRRVNNGMQNERQKTTTTTMLFIIILSWKCQQ